jgi:hypothetical protein
LIHLFLSICACIPLNFCRRLRLMRSPCSMSVCVSRLILVRRLMISHFRLYPHNLFVFYAARAVSKDIGRFVLPRTSCIYYEMTLISLSLAFVCAPLFCRLENENALLSPATVACAVCVPPPPPQFFRFLCGPCHFKGK